LCIHAEDGGRGGCLRHPHTFLCSKDLVKGLNAPRQPRLTDYLVGVEVRRKKATEGRWSLAASQNCSLAKTS
jgi:hypothetical protein